MANHNHWEPPANPECAELLKSIKAVMHKNSAFYFIILISYNFYFICLFLQIWKALIAMGYLFTVTWITAFVMVIVHDRVPDMKKYPPLPDIFLDNVPYIPWAFHMCELTGTVLCFVWLAVLVFHKHRFILLRRFFALSGTVFLLRCITMIITSLSVPGTHLECTPRKKPAYLDGMYDWDDDSSTTTYVRTY